jgi:RecA-family ATPase
MRPYNIHQDVSSTGLPPLIDAAKFLETPMPVPKELVHGLLHQGSKLTIGGSSKAGKTWCLLDLAISVAHGKPWLGLQTEQGRVLYVNFEIQEFAWQRRIREVASAKQIEIKPGTVMLQNTRGYAAKFDEFIPSLKGLVKEQEFALVVIDPIYKLYGETDENGAGDVAALLNELEALVVESGAAVAFAAHFSKGNQAAKESIDRISGSGVFGRDADSLLTLTAHTEPRAFTVETTLRNFASLPSFCVRWEYPLMRRDENLDPAKLKKAGRKATFDPELLLKSINGSPLSAKEWFTKTCEIVPMSQRTFDEKRKVLKQRGKVEKTQSGLWQRKEPLQ